MLGEFFWPLGTVSKNRVGGPWGAACNRWWALGGTLGCTHSTQDPAQDPAPPHGPVCSPPLPQRVWVAPRHPKPTPPTFGWGFWCAWWVGHPPKSGPKGGLGGPNSGEPHRRRMGGHWLFGACGGALWGGLVAPWAWGRPGLGWQLLGPAPSTPWVGPPPWGCPQPTQPRRCGQSHPVWCPWPFFEFFGSLWAPGGGGVYGVGGAWWWLGGKSGQNAKLG